MADPHNNRTYEYMSMDPMSLYGPMMLANNLPAMASGYAAADYGAPSMVKHVSSEPSTGHTINFTDYDDDSSNYYVGKRALTHGASASGRIYSKKYPPALQQALQGMYPGLVYGIRSRSDSTVERIAVDSLRLPEEQESLISESQGSLAARARVKRQTYESSYEKEPPCYGFPLEVNIKSRIKLDQVFPIHGKSQFKKCIKLGQPILPPVQDEHRPY